MKKCYFPVLASALFVFGALSASTQAAPVAWWRFEDTLESGVLANSGTGGIAYNAERKSGASFSTNVSGPYIDDGAGTYYSNASSYVNGSVTDLGSPLSLAANPGLSDIFTASFTIEALGYFTGTPLFSGIFGDNNNFVFSTDSGNRLRLFGVSALGSTPFQATASDTDALVTNQWYSLAAVGTQVGGTTSIQLYINGVASGDAVNAAGGLHIDTVSNFFIGGSNPFPGYIDELRISNAALTPSEFLSASAIPEPSTTYLLLGVGLFAVGAAFQKRINRAKTPCAGISL